MRKNWCCGENMAAFGLLALRLAVGAIFIYHGWGKLADMDKTIAGFGMMGFPLPAFFAWLVALVEFVGGIALVLGVYTKEVAKLLAIIMLVAILKVHLGGGFKGMEYQLALLGGSLALAGVGAGKWRLLKRESCCMKKGEKEDGCCGGSCKCDSKK